MASTDYTGRTVDYLIFQGVEETGKQPIETGFGEGGYLCTGIQKVAQSWTVLFMTDRGSVLNKPTRGSSFLPAVRQGRIQVDADVRSQFAAAADQVRRTMELDAVKSNVVLSDDERLDNASLESFTLDKGASYLYLKIRITSLAGDSRTVFLPVPIVIR